MWVELAPLLKLYHFISDSMILGRNHFSSHYIQILMSVKKTDTIVGKILPVTTLSVALSVCARMATILWMKETLTAQVSELETEGGKVYIQWNL